MKVGDIVRNVMAVHTNPEVSGKPWPAGHVGIVTRVEQTDLNKNYNASGKGDVYVDVILGSEDGPIKCGNYLASVFEVIND